MGLLTYVPAVTPPHLRDVPGTEYYKGASSTWGNPVALSAGIRRMAAYAIWLRAYHTDIEGGYPVTQYDTYGNARTVIAGGQSFATFAISFGAPLDPDATNRVVRKIWANGRELWSSDGGATSGLMYGAAWTFYAGAEDQPVDPLMDADHPGTTPAYRGQMIMVIDHFPINQFENKIPGITAEIADGGYAQLSDAVPDVNTFSYPADPTATDIYAGTTYILPPGDPLALPGMSWPPPTLPVNADSAYHDYFRMPIVNQLALFAFLAGTYQPADLEFDDGICDLVSDAVIIVEAWNFKNLLDAYAQFYDFDYSERGGTLRFFRSVNAENYTVAAELTESQIVNNQSSGTGAMLTTRDDTAAVPVLMQVSYYDQTQQYQLSIQRARRQQFPQPSVPIGSSSQFSCPTVCSAAEAMTAATRALYRGAHQAMRHDFVLPPQYLALEPGDVVKLTFNDRSYIAKLIRTEIQTDFSIKATAVNVAYGPNIVRDSFGGGVTPVIVTRAVSMPVFKNPHSFPPDTHLTIG